MEFTPVQGLLTQLYLLSISTSGPVLHVRLQRPDRQAIALSQDQIGMS